VKKRGSRDFLAAPSAHTPSRTSAVRRLVLDGRRGRKRRLGTWRPSIVIRGLFVTSAPSAVSRTLIRENLKRSVEERFKRLMEVQRCSEELRRAGRREGTD